MPKLQQGWESREQPPEYRIKHYVKESQDYFPVSNLRLCLVLYISLN